MKSSLNYLKKIFNKDNKTNNPRGRLFICDKDFEFNALWKHTPKQRACVYRRF